MSWVTKYYGNSVIKITSFYKMKVKVTQSCPTLCNHMYYTLQNSPGQNPGVGSLSLLQGIFPTQRLNASLLHCQLIHYQLILYQLSHKGSLRILECVAYPFSSGSSPPRNWTGVSCIAGRFFTNWAMREAPNIFSPLFSQRKSRIPLVEPC